MVDEVELEWVKLPAFRKVKKVRFEAAPPVPVRRFTRSMAPKVVEEYDDDDGIFECLGGDNYLYDCGCHMCWKTRDNMNLTQQDLLDDLPPGLGNSSFGQRELFFKSGGYDFEPNGWHY